MCLGHCLALSFLLLRTHRRGDPEDAPNIYHLLKDDLYIIDVPLNAIDIWLTSQLLSAARCPLSSESTDLERRSWHDEKSGDQRTPLVSQ